MTPALSPALQAQLLHERVRLAIAQTQKVRLPHTLVDLALTWLAWQSGAQTAALIYLPLMTVSHLGRSALLARLQAGGRHDDATLMRVGMGLLAYLGLLKALLTLAVFAQPASGWHELWTMVLVGNAAGAIATAGGHQRTYLAWAVPFSSGLVLGWLQRGGLEGPLMALLVVALIAVLSGFVREQGEAQQQRLLLADSLREARDRAERASESRTRFFAAASHDLRQPLTALGYGVASVEAMAGLRDDEPLRRVAANLRRSLDDSQRLLDSLLEVSQLDAGAVQARPQPVPLAALLSQLVDALRPLAEHRGLQLRVDGLDPGLTALADPQLLRRVLQNLIGNALKFTPAGGQVTVLLQHAGASAHVSVIDNGPGIAGELQERVFEEFFQVGNAARDRSQGLGLGLAIVRRLVALMQLELRLDSEPGRGCCFELRLPLLAAAATEPPAPVPTPAPMASGSGLRLLVVDDEAAVREALAMLLQSLGWQVREAEGATQALTQLGDGWSPDALVIDFRLHGGASGLALLQRLRDAGCQAPAWLVTGETSPERIQQALQQLPQGLTLRFKPVDGLALAAEIRAAVSRTP